MAFCTKCGAKIEEGVLFCTNCGNKIGDGISAVQSGNQTTMPSVQGIPNSTTDTANTTVTCQGCLLKGLPINKVENCTYYDCVISEAERYYCGMRGSPELQKKYKNSRVIRTVVIVALYALLGWLIPWRIEAQFGINSWITVVFIILVGASIDYYTDQNSKKKRRENAKRL